AGQRQGVAARADDRRGRAAVAAEQHRPARDRQRPGRVQVHSDAGAGDRVVVEQGADGRVGRQGDGKGRRAGQGHANDVAGRSHGHAAGGGETLRDVVGEGGDAVAGVGREVPRARGQDGVAVDLGERDDVADRAGGAGAEVLEAVGGERAGGAVDRGQAAVV